MKRTQRKRKLVRSELRNANHWASCKSAAVTLTAVSGFHKHELTNEGASCDEMEQHQVFMGKQVDRMLRIQLSDRESLLSLFNYPFSEILEDLSHNLLIYFSITLHPLHPEWIHFATPARRKRRGHICA